MKDITDLAELSTDKILQADQDHRHWRHIVNHAAKVCNRY